MTEGGGAMPAPGLLERLRSDVVVAPTAYDMVAARIVERAGFAAVFCSGYGQAASALGLPDTGSMSLDVLEARVAAMWSSVRVPVLADADTGYDDPRETVARLARAGASAVMIEDQIPAKQCGHVPGKSVVPTAEMLDRLRAARAGRPDGVALIARTDAREPLGFEEAIARGREYAAAGADVVFVEAPESEAELRRVARELPCPAMANVLPGGRTPSLPVATLAELGFRLIVFGLVDLMIAAAALRAGFEELAAAGDVTALSTPLLPFAELNALTGLADVGRVDRNDCG